MIKLLLTWILGLLPAITIFQHRLHNNNAVETTKVSPDKAEKNVFNNGRDSIPYRLVYPEKQIQSEKYPLLVYLHGMGTRGNDNEKPLEKFSVFFFRFCYIKQAPLLYPDPAMPGK